MIQDVHTAAGGSGHRPPPAGRRRWLIFWTYTLFLIPAGWLADRFGPRTILAVVLTAGAVIQLTTGLVHTIAMLVVLRLLLGLFEAAFYPAAAKLSASWLPEAVYCLCSVLINWSERLPIGRRTVAGVPA